MAEGASSMSSYLLLKKYSLIPATLTPMDKYFRVDLDQLEEYVKWLIKFNIGGLAVNVDSGEGPHLYPEERVKILETFSSIVKGRIPIIAGL
ncbi:MAG TPA: hypothetical protein ENH03_03730, partial [Candidatus Bathyarchaeota archaeon]|nr:hypothetical protein [Candidatus Bathyarchaeota archaeon]